MYMKNLDDSSLKCPTTLQTLVDLLQIRGSQFSDKKAYIFLEDGENESDTLTYGELDQKARKIAAYLQSRYSSGERALLLYPPGLDFIVTFFACLYAGIIAIPLFPPTKNQKLARLQAVVTNADAKLSLTTQSVLSNVEKHFEQTPDLAALDWIATDKPIEASQDDWIKPDINRNSLCFLQYTSGSTGTPKGVMVSHGNLLVNSDYIKTAFQLSEKSVSVTWLPSFHDMGLIDGVIQPVYTGFTGILMPPITFLQKPIRWLQAISKYRATHSGGPNFSYDLCTQKINSNEVASLDLSCWLSAYNGAEPVRKGTLNRFSSAFRVLGFKPYFFYPCYGMAEATLMISGGNLDQVPTSIKIQVQGLWKNKVVEISNNSDVQKAVEFVSCGHQWLDHTIHIVNPKTLQECSENQVGEIWVSGSSVAQGYWNQPELSKNTFKAKLNGSESPYLRTGDLGFLKNGELFITGRLKDVIIIRGRNFYPQDIELSVENAHPALRSNATAAFSAEIEGKERLIVVQEVERTYVRKLNVDETVEAIRHQISKNHELQVHAIILLKPGRIFKTSSGKIQRQACKTGYLKQTLDSIAIWEAPIVTPAHQTPSMSLKQSLQTRTTDAIQNWLINWLAQRLGVSVSSVNPHKAFADYGMDSVIAVELAQAIEDELGKEMQIDATLTWNFPTISALSHYLAEQLEQNSFSESQSLNKTLQNTDKNTEELDKLSEEELAQLLIEEISLAQERNIR
ncbi:MAG: AMP-binding protein [Microcystaceae cyanobacterium]